MSAVHVDIAVLVTAKEVDQRLVESTGELQQHHNVGAVPADLDCRHPAIGLVDMAAKVFLAPPLGKARVPDPLSDPGDDRVVLFSPLIAYCHPWRSTPPTPTF